MRIRLLHSEHLAVCLQDAHWISGLNAVFVSPEGEWLSAYPRRLNEPFCSLIQKRSAGSHSCLNCPWTRGEQGSVDFRSVSCPALLKPLVYDLQVEDQLVGRFLLLSYREAKWGIDACRQSWIRLARNGVPLSWNEWKAAWDVSPTLNEHELASLSRWLRLAVQETLRELDADPRLKGKEKALPGLVHRVCAIVKEHHTQTLRLSDIAKSCGVSPEHLSRVFHHATGIRFRDYLAEVRLSEACRLLMESNDRIADIAEAVGHSSLSRFNRAFKHYTGMTPGAWRRRARNRRTEESSPNTITRHQDDTGLQ